MDGTFPTLPMSLNMNQPAANEVGEDQLNSLLGNRRFGRKQKDANDTFPSVEEYDSDTVRELQEFCQQKGIVGINFGRMSPSAALTMLKGRYREDCTQKSKKGLLHG